MYVISANKKQHRFMCNFHTKNPDQKTSNVLEWPFTGRQL